MDAMGFGMGCCCLQLTFQACNVTEARRLYDSFVPIGPIMVRSLCNPKMPPLSGSASLRLQPLVLSTVATLLTSIVGGMSLQEALMTGQRKRGG